VLILSVENLLFLVFPSPTPVGGTAGASQAGRMVVVTSIRFLTAVLVLGTAARVDGIVRFAGGGRRASLGAAFGALVASAAFVTVAVAARFRRLDLSLDLVE
jgi:hypothetical protein